MSFYRLLITTNADIQIVLALLAFVSLEKGYILPAIPLMAAYLYIGVKRRQRTRGE
jgi:hypothetical protein